MDKCCGNCGWWIVLQHESLSRSGRLGHCSHPMPAACLERDEMYETEGTGCPCHKEKES